MIFFSVNHWIRVQSFHLPNRKKWYFRVKKDFENCKRAVHLECQVRRAFEAFGLQTLF